MCLNDEDCINKNCTKEKVCQFIPLDQKCSSGDPIDFSMQCGVGAYCNSTNFCNLQIKKNQKCENTFDCENNLVCFNKTCSMEYGSVKDGEKIDLKLLSADFGFNYDSLCQTYEFDVETNKCFSYKYANVTYMKSDKDGYVECNKNNGNECLYENSIGKSFVRNCECGFNADGKGYCPIDFNGNFFNIFSINFLIK